MRGKELDTERTSLQPTHKSGSLKGLSPEERIERYSVLLQFEKAEDIDTLVLAKQWGVHRLGVSGMVSAAKNSKKLRNEMESLGYRDNEFPEWWYSSEREQQSSDMSSEVPTSPEESSKVLSSTEKSRYEPIPPGAPAPKEGRRGRPPILGQDSTFQDSTPSDSLRHEDIRGTSQFSKSDLKLLAGQQINEITPGRWMKRSERGDGSIVFSPVNPQRELLNLKRSAQGDRVMSAIGEQMITSLTVNTQAIMKKIAFNPSIFQCWQFVSNAEDPDTGYPFIPPDWDFGDYVNHCVLWTTENEYGIIPTVLYNRPSRYTIYKDMMRPRNQGEPYSHDEYRGDKTPISNLNFPSRWGEESKKKENEYTPHVQPRKH